MLPTVYGVFLEDDLMIYSAKFDDHLQYTEKVLERLRKYGIKRKGSKCQLIKKEISYLGGVVSHEGYREDPKNITAVE